MIEARNDQKLPVSCVITNGREVDGLFAAFGKSLRRPLGAGEGCGGERVQRTTCQTSPNPSLGKMRSGRLGPGSGAAAVLCPCSGPLETLIAC